MVRLSAAVACAALAILPGPAAAQIISGTVINAATNTPVQGVMVTLIATSDSTDRQITNTDARGEFLLAGMSAGEYVLRLRKIGYAPIDVPPRTIKADENWTLRYEMDPVATALDTMRARAERASLTPGSEWFLKHYRTGKGYFTSGDAIASAGIDACDYFGKIPGLAIHGAAPISESRWDGERGMRCKDGRYIMPTFTPRCLRTVVDRLLVVAFVDSGALMVRTVDDEKLAISARVNPNILNSADTLPRELPIRDIAGIEVFRDRAEVPNDFSIPVSYLSYNESLNRCAYILIWTRRSW